METKTLSPVKFTEGAISEVNRLKSEPGFDNTQYLRVGVKGGGCSGMSYLLGFDAQKPNDHVYEAEGFQFIIDKAHEMYLLDMEIDYQGGLNSRGFTFKNPNASSTCGCGSSFAV
jgi:iron-sulfur cluster assembly protein